MKREKIAWFTPHAGLDKAMTRAPSDPIAAGRYFEGPRRRGDGLYMVDTLARSVVALSPGHEIGEGASNLL